MALIARLSLGFLWSFTGLVSIFYAENMGYRILADAGITGFFADACIYGGSITDIMIGAWLFLGRGIAACCILQIVFIIIYTVLLSIIDPVYWLHPFGPLSKNIPILVLVYVLYKYAKGLKIDCEAK